MSLGNFFKGALAFVQKALDLAGLSTTDQILVVMQFIPAVVSKIQDIIKAKGIPAEDRGPAIDFILNQFDQYTGEDAGAADLVKGLPPELEEKLFDHVKESIRILAYHYCGVPGYGSGSEAPNMKASIALIEAAIKSLPEAGFQAAPGAVSPAPMPMPGVVLPDAMTKPGGSCFDRFMGCVDRLEAHKTKPTAFMIADQVAAVRDAVLLLVSPPVNVVREAKKG
jgi:hypothetical protein